MAKDEVTDAPVDDTEHAAQGLTGAGGRKIRLRANTSVDGHDVGDVFEANPDDPEVAGNLRAGHFSEVVA